jgi:hypothetical protein
LHLIGSLQRILEPFSGLEAPGHQRVAVNHVRVLDKRGRTITLRFE